MDQLPGLLILIVLIAAFVLLSGGGRSAGEVRMRRRWEASFDSASRRVERTDATGVLRCKHCGSSGGERAGRCPSCGAVL